MPGSRNIDIQLFLNANRFSAFQWTVFALPRLHWWSSSLSIRRRESWVWRV